jgi:hypothetical protein
MPRTITEPFIRSTASHTPTHVRAQVRSDRGKGKGGAEGRTVEPDQELAALQLGHDPLDHDLNIPLVCTIITQVENLR